VDDAFLSLIYCCLLYGGLTLYFDHVVPNSFGLAHHPLFFLDPVYWGFESKKKNDPNNVSSDTTMTSNVAIPDINEAGEKADDDVKAEADAVKSGEANVNSKAIVINRLQKTVF